MQLQKWIELLKWPLVAVLLGGLAIVAFRASITSILQGLRNRSIRIRNTEFGAEQQQPLPPSDNPAVAPPSNSSKASMPKALLFEQDDNPTITETANNIQQQVAGMQFQDTAERDRWLFRQGAILVIQREFEQIYRLLYSSQLSALHAASSARNAGGLNDETLRGFYDDASKHWPVANAIYEFESWRNYLTASALLVPNEGRWAITHKGLLYLHYLVASGLTTPHLPY